jgi:hypothetical protein
MEHSITFNALPDSLWRPTLTSANLSAKLKAWRRNSFNISLLGTPALRVEGLELQSSRLCKGAISNEQRVNEQYVVSDANGMECPQ